MRITIYPCLFLIFFIIGCEEPLSTNENNQIIFRTTGNSYFITDSVKVFIKNNTLSDFEIALRCGGYLEMYYQRKENNTWSNNLWFSWMSLLCFTAIDTIKKDNTFEFTIPPDEIDISGTYRLMLANDTLIVSNSFEVK
jgi:hypothetical protein